MRSPMPGSARGVPLPASHRPGKALVRAPSHPQRALRCSARAASTTRALSGIGPTLPASCSATSTPSSWPGCAGAAAWRGPGRYPGLKSCDAPASPAQAAFQPWGLAIEMRTHVLTGRTKVQLARHYAMFSSGRAPPLALPHLTPVGDDGLPQTTGAFVRHLTSGSPAELCGGLRIGDLVRTLRQGEAREGRLLTHILDWASQVCSCGRVNLFDSDEAAVTTVRCSCFPSLPTSSLAQSTCVRVCVCVCVALALGCRLSTGLACKQSYW
jgi:hypothetical protein